MVGTTTTATGKKAKPAAKNDSITTTSARSSSSPNQPVKRGRSRPAGRLHKNHGGPPPSLSPPPSNDSMAPPYRWHYSSCEEERNNTKNNINNNNNSGPTRRHDEVVAGNDGWHNIVQLLRTRRRIVVLTGAGISVSCGIPDFRSKECGLYNTLDAQSLGLSSPEELFDIHFFREDPVPFYKFAKQLYFPGGTDPPVKVSPSDTHKLLAMMDTNKMLLRVYSQNIDGLEETAGVDPQRIAYVHGSLKCATCETCRTKVTAPEFGDDILAGRVARCRVRRQIAAATPPTRTSARKRARGPDHSNNTVPTNTCGGVLKPGVTFFGEALQDSIQSKLEADRGEIDALIVIGTSLSVAPISKVIDFFPKSIPRILINRNIAHPPSTTTSNGSAEKICHEEREDFRENYIFDAYLLGNCDDVMRTIGMSLFDLHHDDDTNEFSPTTLANADEIVRDRWRAVKVPNDRVFLFPGAEPPPPAP